MKKLIFILCVMLLGCSAGRPLIVNLYPSNNCGNGTISNVSDTKTEEKRDVQANPEVAVPLQGSTATMSQTNEQKKE